MSAHNIGPYTVYVKSNKITIISDSRRFFQREILPSEIYSCESKEDVYLILKSLLEMDEIYIKDDDNSVLMTFNINKEKLISISLPEIDNDKLPFDYSLMKVETEIYEIKLFSLIIMVLTLLNIFTYILL